MPAHERSPPGPSAGAIVRAVATGRLAKSFGPLAPLDRTPHAPLLPSCLPPSGSGERWAWLQRLRRTASLDPEPWLQALEAGRLEPATDLLAVLVERLDGAGSERLLRWWLTDPVSDAAASPQQRLQLLDLIGRRRDPRCAALLRQAVSASGGKAAASSPPGALLPLLGHQRDPADFALLRRLAQDPGAATLRRRALEGLAVGLSAWPLPPLRQLLTQLAEDLDPLLAGQAVDLLARLPGARQLLWRLAGRRVDPAVAERLQRRLRAVPARSLLLLAHGRSGGLIPAELRLLAQELEQRRGAPVRLQVLTNAELPPVPELRRAGSAAAPQPLTLVPLFLLPGSHVRHDLPAIAADWRRSGPVQRLPFLGAWPAWQRALGDELAALVAASDDDGPAWLLHHPVDGSLARRYLAHLEAVTTAACRATPYSAADLEDLKLANLGAALPLALAANRLTESLPAPFGAPLLQRPRFHRLLLEQLEALP